MAAGEALAVYELDPRIRLEGEWRQFAVPFHDLVWRATAMPGGPLPNHPLKSLTILVEGMVDIAAVRFLRPRTIARSQGVRRGFCLGGRVTPFVRGEPVYAQALDVTHQARRSVSVDQRGLFCFEATPPGVYRVWAQTQQGILHNRRGPLVEVGADTMILRLDRPSGVMSDEEDGARHAL